MTRAALLPAGADPFLLSYWLRNYARVWADEVDELVVYVCGQTDPEALDYIGAQVAAVPHAWVVNTPNRTDHGTVIGQLLNITDADLVMLCEDDAFVRHPGVVNERFRRIERGECDVVGTARGNAGPKLIARAAERFGALPETESGETGHSLYPCFLFARREELLGLPYSPRFLPEGTYIPSLDYTCDQEEGVDTFTEASWDLRARGLVIESEAAYRSNSAFPGSGTDRVDGGANNGDAPWFHVGSLSSGYGCAFMAPPNPTLITQVSEEQERVDWTKRASWWQRAYDLWDGGIPDHHRQTVESFDAFCRATGMVPEQIAWWRRSYDPMVSWDERP